MEAKKIEDQGFKNFEYQGWEVSVDGYDSGFTPLTRQCIPAVLDALEVESGDYFLDVATGLGYLASEASERQAKVIGIDFSPSMINAASKIDPSVKFVVGDAENLSFPDESFTKVAMAFGILHLENPERALREAFRVLKPRGTYSFVVWTTPEDGSPGFSTIMEAIKSKGDMSVKLPDGPAFFHYSEPDTSISSLKDAGFASVDSSVVRMTWKLPNAESFFNAFYRGTARTGGLLRAQDKSKLSEIKREAERLVSERFQAGEEIQIPMSCIVFTAKKV